MSEKTESVMPARTAYLVFNGISMALRLVRVSLAGYIHREILSRFATGFIYSEPSPFLFVWSELALNGLIAFVTFQSPRSRICIRMGHVVMLWAFVIDLLTLGFSAKQLLPQYMHENISTQNLSVDPSLIALAALDIVATGLSFMLMVWHWNFKDEHRNESKMPTDKMAVVWTLAAFGGAIRIARLALVSDYQDIFVEAERTGDFSGLESTNVVTFDFLPLWTFTSVYGILCFLTTFMYTMRWSRPTFYLNGVFLAVAFIIDLMCLGWASKMFALALIGGDMFQSKAVALGALSIIGFVISFVQAFIHVWSSPPHPEPAWFGGCNVEDMKLKGSDRDTHLGLGIPNLALRVVRVALAADLWNKYLNGVITRQTESSLNSISWTLWGAMGFAHAVSGHYHGFFATKSTYVLHYLMLLFAVSWDLGSAGFAVTQWIGGLDDIEEQSEFQAHAALSFIQFFFMLATLIVHVTRAMPNDDDDSSSTDANNAVPLDPTPK